MYIQERELESLRTLSPQNYAIGSSYINLYHRHIDSLNITPYDTYYQVEALFTNRWGEYPINIRISKEGKILDYHCTCDYQRGHVPCGHIIYVLLILQDMDQDEIKQLEERELYYQQLLEERKNQYLR